ncbi:MAG: helix-turn-helix transcriptional regulator [Coriobacteriales bacterium]
MYLARLRRDESAQGNAPVSEQMTAYIEQHLETVTLADIGTRFGYHPNYVSSLLRRQTGQTFSQLLLRTRMERACLLLRTTSLSIERIATMVGYPDTSNFYRAFRRTRRMSPREYRMRQA